MKKLILFLSVIALIISSCSKDDDNTPKQLPLTPDNLKGTWYIKQIIKPDGSVINYQGKCTTKKDYVRMWGFIENKAELIVNGDDCVYTNQQSYCSDFLVVGNKITACSYFFMGTVSDLTANSLRIDYDETQYIGIIEPDGMKALIYYR